MHGEGPGNNWPVIVCELAVAAAAAAAAAAAVARREPRLGRAQ